MLSYRHQYHAGNHADVLKHLVLVEALERLCAKDKPLWYIDTHAGAGSYPLGKGIAGGHAEHDEGISRIWGADTLPPALQRYLDRIRAANPAGRLRNYPGSALIADRLLRPGDRLWLYELHPADAVELARRFGNQTARVSVTQGDGFAGLRAALPPLPRRALALIDPSYEIKDDYTRVVEALRDALRRFATGVYVVWYPMLARREARELPARLEALAGDRWLQASLRVRAPSNPQGGMFGSAVFVLNPPFQLRESLAHCGDTLLRLLARPEEGRFEIRAGAAC